MQEKDEVQDMRIDALKEFLIEKFNNLECNLSKEITRTDGKLTLMEEKNCRKHQEILETTNKYRGELEIKMDQLKDRMFTKSDYDMFLTSNNGKLRMIDERITKTEKKIDKVWQYLTIAGAIIFAIWQFGQQIILEIFRKKI